jgi:plasmid stabilization system protein ParE
MKPCYFHPQALLEIEATAKFYDEQSQGLGHTLIELVAKKLEQISQQPQLYQKIHGNIRRCHLQKFPFGIIFREQAEHIEIIALAHAKREPHYWQTRK